MSVTFSYESVPFNPAWLDEAGLMTRVLDHTGDLFTGEIVPVRVGHQLITLAQAQALGLFASDGRPRRKLSPHWQQLAEFVEWSKLRKPLEFRIEPAFVVHEVRWGKDGYEFNAVAEIRHNYLAIYALDRKMQRIDSPTALLDRQALFYRDGELTWGSLGTHARHHYVDPSARRFDDWVPVYRPNLYQALDELLNYLRQLHRGDPNINVLSNVLSGIVCGFKYDGSVPMVFGEQTLFTRPARATLDDILFFRLFSWYYRQASGVENRDRTGALKSLSDFAQASQGYLQVHAQVRSKGLTFAEYLDNASPAWYSTEARSIYTDVARDYAAGRYPLLYSPKKES